jgi:hypothetical protein
MIVSFRPWHHENPSYPGYYAMAVSLFAFGGYILPPKGTPLELLEVIGMV